MNPTGDPLAELIRATRPAHSGATALVPPMTLLIPSTRTKYPVCGSASPDTSGTPRFPSLVFLPFALVTWRPSCHGGSGKKPLTPPPLAPPAAPSFHTVSLRTSPLTACRLVPPHASTCGLEAGKSTCRPASPTPPLDPLSPEATHTVIPISAAAWNAPSSADMAWGVHDASGPPQLIEMTEGLFLSS